MNASLPSVVGSSSSSGNSTASFESPDDDVGDGDFPLRARFAAATRCAAGSVFLGRFLMTASVREALLLLVAELSSDVIGDELTEAL